MAKQHPAEPIPLQRERNRACHLVVQLMKVVHQSIFPEMGEALGADLAACLVACAVCIGHTESMPMTATKIAFYLGMPRTTVLRKLKRLVALGVVEQRLTIYLLAKERVPDYGYLVDRIKKAVDDYQR
jgi:hypothetical protein